jgi:hypothetical protein
MRKIVATKYPVVKAGKPPTLDEIAQRLRKEKPALPAEFRVITEAVDELTTAVLEVGTKAHAEHLTLKELVSVEFRSFEKRIAKLEGKGES